MPEKYAMEVIGARPVGEKAAAQAASVGHRAAIVR